MFFFFIFCYFFFLFFFLFRTSEQTSDESDLGAAIVIKQEKDVNFGIDNNLSEIDALNEFQLKNVLDPEAIYQNEPLNQTHERTAMQKSDQSTEIRKLKRRVVALEHENQKVNAKLDRTLAYLDRIEKYLHENLPSSSGAPVKRLHTEMTNKSPKSQKRAKIEKSTIASNACTPNEIDVSEIESLLPLSTVEAIQYFEHKLDDPRFRNVASNYFGKQIIYIPGQLARSYAYTLIDIIFTRQVLTAYTWTGSTTSSEENKLPFSLYNNIIKLFFQVIHSTDNSYTWIENQDFIQIKVLKYARSRAQIYPVRCSSGRVVKRRTLK